MVQTIKHKNDNKKNIQMHRETNNLQNSNTIKIMKNFEMESEYRAEKETDRKYNHLHPQFKYRNDIIYIQ